jgi:hypothetical protein
MILGTVQLTSGYAAGSALLRTTDLTDILAQMDAVPSRCTIVGRNNPAIATTYAITAIGGGVIALGAVLSGADRPYAQGDFVRLFTSMADAAAAASVLPPVVPSGTSGTIILDLSQGAVFEPAALTGATNFLLASPGARPTFTLAIIPGGQPITWGFGPLFPGGTVPTPTTTPGKLDTFTFAYRSANGQWYGYVAGQNS